MLVASLIFCCPDVYGALAGPAADGPSPATSGTKPLPSSQVQIGMASWYSMRWQGRPTASRECCDRHQPTAVPRTAPLGTQVIVTSLANGHMVRVGSLIGDPTSANGSSISLTRPPGGSIWYAWVQRGCEDRVSGGLAAPHVVPSHARHGPRQHGVVPPWRARDTRCTLHGTGRCDD
jgi:hypothetical protein